MLLNVAKVLVVVGAVMILAGGLLYAMHRMGLGRLPGDLTFGGKNWRVYLPIGTSILLSILLTLLLYVLSRFRK